VPDNIRKCLRDVAGRARSSWCEDPSCAATCRWYLLSSNTASSNAIENVARRPRTAFAASALMSDESKPSAQVRADRDVCLKATPCRGVEQAQRLVERRFLIGLREADCSADDGNAGRQCCVIVARPSANVMSGREAAR
jgi:hypothetical protein